MGSKVLLGDVIRLDASRRQPLSSRQREGRKGSYPYYGAQGVVDHLDDYTYDGTYLLVAEDGENLRSRKLPLANLVTGKFRVNNHAHVLSGTDKCDIRILGWLLNSMNLTPGTAVGILDQIHPMLLGPNPCGTAWGSCNPGRSLP